MMLPNHLVGGFVFSGIIGGLCGENIFASKTAIVVVLIASMIPDIDNPKSPIGRVLLPLSKYINTHYGHRTITHSLVALCATTLICYVCQCHTLFWFLGYLSHLIFDMLTLQGVPLFFPFLKNPAVIPGDPNLRFRTGDIKAESISFASFVLLGVTLQPLMSNGFWTSYNALWGTQKHLASEFHKAGDLLGLEYTYYIANQRYEGKGYCIEATENKTIIWENGHWFTLETSGLKKVEKVTFFHTGKQLAIHEKKIIDIDTDSLNAIITGKKLIEIDITAARKAQVFENGISDDFLNFKKKFPEMLIFASQDSIFREELFFDVESPTAKIKRAEIQNIKAEYQSKKIAYDNRQMELKILIADTTADIRKREQIVKKIAELKRETPPTLDEFRIKQLEFEAEIAQNTDNLNRQIRKLEHEQKQRDKAAHVIYTRNKFTGVIKWVDF